MSETPENTNSELAKIEEIVNKEIRPALQMHGGDIELLSVQDNVVKIRYQGACGGCPGAAMGTLHMIQTILQEHNPQIKVQMAA
jgi:NFU1 iron-sulfur cluster scaffold homolog, mitochondrial